MNLSDILNVDIEAEAVHIANKKWWVDIHTGEPLNRDKGEQLMLVVTELSEAMEGARKDLMDDHLPQYKMEHVEIIDAFIRLLDYRYGHGHRDKFHAAEYIHPTSAQFKGQPPSFGACLYTIVQELMKPSGMRNEMEDIDWTINLLYFYSVFRGFDHLFLEIYEAKMAYNATRVDHSIEHRLSEHGKKI